MAKSENHHHNVYVILLDEAVTKASLSASAESQARSIKALRLRRHDGSASRTSI
jgi:hypothetical protein